jgi:hypothetical protein
MRITLGNDYFQARSGKAAPVVLDTAKTINGHVLIVGSSGVGKSHTIRRMISDVVRQGTPVRFHVFDVHGDLDIPGASVVQFSEQARCGLNPLRVNPDPHFGGVRKCIQSFIRTVNQASTTRLGVKQESVLRNLLDDVYRDFGFVADDASTWTVDGFQSRLVSGGADNRVYLEVPIAQKDEVKALGARWDPEQKHWWIHADKYKGDIRKWPAATKERAYPTVADVAAYAKRLHEERFLGSDQRAIQALGYLNKKAQAYQRKLLQNIRDHRSGDVDDDTMADLEEAREKAIDAYISYARSIQTGFEFDNLLKYDSADVLKSVLDRLNNLKATGLFKNEPPPFDRRSPVWRYKLNALLSEEKKMMVLFILQEIFNRAVQRGEQPDVVEVVVLDELGVYTSNQDEDGGDGIIGVVSREARKFGLALWAANQSPANVPESLSSSVGTKIILGLDEMHWQSATTKLRIETKLLDWIRPHHTMGVQMKERGALKNRWWWVSL